MDIVNKFIDSTIAAYHAVSDHQEEINKLNVFPIPDGDTGTNVTLTMQNVVKELGKLPSRPEKAQVLRAVKQGSLMGARGNSGVITSQILRGFTEGAAQCDVLDPQSIATAFASAKEVAYKAVRKPVEGTILTVIKDMAAYAQEAADAGASIEEMLRGIAKEGMESVKRTPDLMPTLKENGVVDSGGLALAVMVEGFVDNFLGTSLTLDHDDSIFKIGGGGKVEIEHLNDWEDHNYRYCTEFLFKSDDLDVEEAYNFLESIGDCQLVVGEHPDFKIHVHTDQPGVVLTWMIERGQPHEIFIHNMDMQSEERLDKIAADEEAEKGPRKPIGMVAVAVGSGNTAILKSLGVDKVVSGGQTMNPSTQDIVDAMNSVNADSIIVFPGNKNIIMAANAAAEMSDVPCGVVPSTSTPETFSAILAFNPEVPFEANLEAMTEALDGVVTGEVTTAVKDAVGEDGLKIHKGDVMGIIDGSIKIVGRDVYDTCIEVIDSM
ncbi:MAG: DAK2 domain-containing protein, partial [Coriobacteriales bacterium]